MQYRMTRPVSRRTCTLGNTFTKIGGHTTKWALINFTFFGPRERNTKMLKLINSFRGIATQIFDCILIAQPIRALDRIVHMPTPVIITHIAKRCRNATLSSNSVATRWKNLRNTCCPQAFFRAPKRCTQTRPAGANNDNIELMVYELIFTHSSLHMR